MRKYTRMSGLYLLGGLLVGGCSTVNSKETAVEQVIEKPIFQNVAVHDPSVWEVGDEKYIIGSHLQFAKTNDLIKWESLSQSVPTTDLFEDVYTELAEDFEFAKSDTLWAGDIIQLEDRKYYMYYCVCEGSSPLSVLGLAVANNIEGPYKKVDKIMTSGSGLTPDGQTYNANVHPNVIDPHVFYDKEDNLWMVYGSYSGGIFILPMDPTTGKPKEKSYGTKLMGGNHSRIEAPYMMYNKDTDYYYLFTSFGGLDAVGGYNIRVARSKNPDGPFEDYKGQDMTQAKGPTNSFFDDKAIERYGTKLIGNYVWDYGKGVSLKGYVSPGHNSTYYDEETNQSFIIFHSRFVGMGERYEVRVHSLLFNEDGWPMIAPRRYAGEQIEEVALGDVQGDYMMIVDQEEITSNRILSQEVRIDGNKISGTQEGEVQITEDGMAVIKLGGEEVKGQFLPQWDDYAEKQTITFTGLTSEGKSIQLVRK